MELLAVYIVQKQTQKQKETKHKVGEIKALEEMSGEQNSFDGDRQCISDNSITAVKYQMRRIKDLFKWWHMNQSRCT